jgi:serine/threonine protein kinase/Tol biopolymer transport system component
MTLAPGTRLGVYEIVAPVGAGGMGEVYRARDTRLDRTVAIKVLPAALADNADLRERFDREARAISSLQHPNICALFDVGEAPGASASELGIRYLVLEFLEGETLAARLARLGAMPLQESLRLAIDICDALDAAHRSNIVHRDLKPANVFLARSASGSGSPAAKLLDFGLAKAATPVVTTSSASMQPTTPPTLTAQGSILGTFQYMAPEQIEGIEADARTDIFAFGALLFEMLTGRAAFEGKTRATLLGAILKDEPPPVSGLDARVPTAIDHVIATCVAKDPLDRWQSMRDVRHELQWIASGAATAATSTVAPAPPSPRWQRWAALAVVAAVSIGVTALLMTLTRPAPSSEPVRFALSSPRDWTFMTPPGGGTGLAAQAAVSPDGKSIVFVANRQQSFQLWLRPIDALEARPIDGSEGAAFPFWSPDSRNIGFFANGKLKKVSATGGPPLVLCDAPGGRGGTWSRDNVIVFTPATSGGVHRVSAGGGNSSPVTTLDTEYGETNHRFPWFLPDGRHFLFVATVGTCCPPLKDARVKIGALDNVQSAPLLTVESAAAYAAGHLLFNRQGTLMAQPFDAASRAFTGDPFPVVDGVLSEGSRYASFSVSGSGVLVHAEGIFGRTTRLIWFDRAGRQLQTVGEAAIYGNVALSGDERRLVVSMNAADSTNRSLWVVDAETGTRTRLTFENTGVDSSPIWSPDDQQIVFTGSRAGIRKMLQKLVSGIGTETVLLESPNSGVTPTDWTADGRIVFSQALSTAGTPDLFVLPLAGRKPFAYLATAYVESEGVLSPNGKWMAYVSNENGASEIYVQSFPTGAGKFQISQNGGIRPLWRRDGKELFYLTPEGQMMSMAILDAETFRASPPSVLFQVRVASSIGAGAGRQYGVSRDGQRFIVNALEQQASTQSLTVVLDWLAATQR